MAVDPARLSASSAFGSSGGRVVADARSGAALGAAAVVATLTVGIAVVGEVAFAGPDARPFSTRLTLVLVCVGLLCVVGLAIPRAATTAWLAAVCAAGLATVDVVGLARSGDFGSVSAPVAETARVGLAVVALAYVWSRPSLGSRTRLVRAAALWAFGAVVAADAAALVVGLGSTTPLELDAARIANRVLLGWVTAAVLVALVIDVAPAADRARQRAGLEPGTTGGRWLRRATLTIDEAMPFGARRRRAAEERERARLAADLHATVLPGLRTALAASASGGTAPEIGRRLADAVGEVEHLMAARQPVVVETLGLVPGLEWLAERDQARFDITIELDVAPDPAEARAPATVERAAFRVAQLALDNVGRHSRAATARLEVDAAADHVTLRIADDGIGFDEARAGTTAGRGIADMRMAAAEIGASLRIAEDAGTTVTLAWPPQRTA